MKGLFGRYLDVDLSKGQLSNYPIPENWQSKYVGGRGIVGRILLEELEPQADPLEPENMLIFGTGPFQGLGIPGGGRHILMSKSPNTNWVNGSYVGGFVGQELGKSGYDGIIFRGRASEPTYLVIKDGQPRLKSAKALWGKDTATVEEKLQEEEGNVRVASIGPAGENKVRYACIIHDRNRAAGRPGFGTVMGSKNLKAVAISGSEDKEVADEESFKKLRADYAQLLNETQADSLGKYGTAGGLGGLNEQGILPTKNFQKGSFEGAEQLTGENMYDSILTERDTCSGCPIRCKRVVETTFNGEKVSPKYGGPEYETLAALGSLCLNSDLDAIALANQKCNQYGLDTISTGVTIAFSMEASERGLLEEDISWGDPQQVAELPEKIARREGIGDLLAQGVHQLSEELGADFGMEIKGQEIPMHEPRGKKALGISYATTPRGANHMEGLHDTVLEKSQIDPELEVEGPVDRFEYEGKGRLQKTFEDLRSFNNSLVMCSFTTAMVGENYPFPKVRDLFAAVTGRQIDKDKMFEIGERNYLLLRLLTGREGHTAEHDGLPKRFTEPLPEGGSEGEAIPEDKLDQMLKEYYEARGYDRQGPKPERIEELDLPKFRD
ncbi:MAG: aldehyde ferredoxin oxidoreductase family protein [Candidatus Acetothermia bacterium]